jgi:hypothetical protein
MPKTNPNEYQARVFISCGQDKDNDAERRMTAQVSKWFKNKNYIPYLATEIQTHEELNLQIIDALKSCDYFLFINLPRGEPFSSKVGSATRRGSLYSNQELAVAYAFGFKKMILIAHNDVIEEGVSKFITVNTPKFDAFEEVLPIVRGAVKKSGWKSTFSRHLQLGGLSVDAPRVYGDHTGARNLRISHVKIINNRPDIGAAECTARLVEIEQVGSVKQKSPDQSRLKAMLRQGYSQFIWPKSVGSVDVFGIDDNAYPKVYLLSEADEWPRRPIINALGTYRLAYEIYAERFPSLTFTVELELPASPNGVKAKLILPPDNREAARCPGETKCASNTGGSDAETILIDTAKRQTLAQKFQWSLGAESGSGLRTFTRVEPPYNVDPYGATPYGVNPDHIADEGTL